MLVKKLTMEECKEALDRERAATAEMEQVIRKKDLCLQAAIDLLDTGEPCEKRMLDLLRAGLAAEQRWPR